METFSVCQFFEDGSYEYDVRHVRSKKAVERAIALTQTVGARIGTTVKVIIIDAGDCIGWEWERGKGITFPPQLAGKLKEV